MVDCSGLIFNRHKWLYKHEDFRICQKCGEMQEVDYGVPGDLPWRQVQTLGEWQTHLNAAIERKQNREINYQNMLKEQEKAKKYLKNEEK